MAAGFTRGSVLAYGSVLGEHSEVACGAMADEGGRFWFCVAHHAVESPDGPGDMCPIIDRLGPYASYDEAAAALQKAQERNEAWDNDPRWED